MEVLVEAPVRYQLVHKQQLLAVSAAMTPADELHEVPVAEPAQGHDLGHVVLPGPLRPPRQPLHRHRRHERVRQLPSVHFPESSLTELPVLGEVASRCR